LLEFNFKVANLCTVLKRRRKVLFRAVSNVHVMFFNEKSGKLTSLKPAPINSLVLMHRGQFWLFVGSSFRAVSSVNKVLTFNCRYFKF